jgi:radical SAM protein with 4Fe4S-binding SPASM domain
VDPISDYVRYAIRHVTGANNDRYDRSKSERVFVIDTTGDVFNVVESYEPEFRYGNLFTSPFHETVASPERNRSIVLSRQRLERFCHHCPYFGNCPGIFVANATSVERKVLEISGCPIRSTLDYIIDVYKQTGLNDFILENHKTVKSPAKMHPALSVG